MRPIRGYLDEKFVKILAASKRVLDILNQTSYTRGCVVHRSAQDCLYYEAINMERLLKSVLDHLDDTVEQDIKDQYERIKW